MQFLGPIDLICRHPKGARLVKFLEDILQIACQHRTVIWRDARFGNAITDMIK